jgi:hypothetical protein
MVPTIAINVQQCASQAANSWHKFSRINLQGTCHRPLRANPKTTSTAARCEIPLMYFVGAFIQPGRINTGMQTHSPKNALKRPQLDLQFQLLHTQLAQLLLTQIRDPEPLSGHEGKHIC